MKLRGLFAHKVENTTGPWPISDRAEERLEALEQDFQQQLSVLKLRTGSRIDEMLEILRPEGVPDEAKFNRVLKAFVLPIVEQVE